MQKKILIALVFLILITSCKQKNTNNNGNISGTLTIFHAGSLSVPMKELADSFMLLHPNVDILLESAGSMASARKITDLNKKCDIIAVSDYDVIDKMLIPKFASWNLKFATNEMCIAYTSKSKYANEINQNNWYKILQKQDVKYGRADENADPCGYRTIFTCKLTEDFYKEFGFTKKIIQKDQQYIRPKEVDLLALLETQTIDYVFIYRSVAEQHHLKYVLLPDEVNLKNADFSKQYAKVETYINGNKPSEKRKVVGEPMIYSISILKKAHNIITAIEFLKYMLSKDKGIKIIEKNGQPSIIPFECQQYQSLPDELKSFALSCKKN